MALNHAIRQLCVENKTTLAAVERALGLGNGTIRRWDDSHSPGVTYVASVAGYFGITVDRLLALAAVSGGDKNND